MSIQRGQEESYFIQPRKEPKAAQRGYAATEIMSVIDQLYLEPFAEMLATGGLTPIKDMVFSWAHAIRMEHYIRSHGGLNRWKLRAELEAQGIVYQEVETATGEGSESRRIAMRLKWYDSDYWSLYNEGKSHIINRVMTALGSSEHGRRVIQDILRSIQRQSTTTTIQKSGGGGALEVDA